ncbi:hypothetical protein ACUODJ_55820, partial [Escherichia sp. HC-CC]
LSARGWQVTGSKTTQDGVEAARMSGIDSYLLRMEPELVCDSDDLDALMDADALVITLPARRSGMPNHPNPTIATFFIRYLLIHLRS